MHWTTPCVVISCTLHLVLGGGYSKDRPAQSWAPGSVGGGDAYNTPIPSSSGGYGYSASGYGSGGYGASYYGGNGYGSLVSMDYVSRYMGPTANPTVLPDGTIADTPEVVSAKAAHLAALEKAKALWYGSGGQGAYGGAGLAPWASAGGYPGAGSVSWPRPGGYSGTGSASWPGPGGYSGAGSASWPGPGGYSGADSASWPGQGGYAGAGSASWPGPGGSSGAGSASLAIGYSGASYSSAGALNKPYNGPLAMTTVLSSGYLADTPAIAAARVAHLGAVQKAQADAEAWRLEETRRTQEAQRAEEAWRAEGVRMAEEKKKAEGAWKVGGAWKDK